jgi:signal transduction histidine kinase
MLAPQMTSDRITDEVRLSLVEIDALVATFNAILRIAQAEMGAGVEQFTDFNLSEAVIDVADLYRPVAEEKSQHITLEAAPDVTFNGDRHLITQTVANILDNAIKYTPRGGAIAVTLSVGPSLIELAVADSGPGIPKAFHHKVTEKFFRLEQSRSSPGNGLGLSLVSAAVKLHKGDLSFADNEPGLKVIIRLPHS